MPPVANGPQHQLAVFIDFENIALGLREGSPPFDVRRLLDRLLEKGKVIVKVAYADWNRFRTYTTDLHENGIQLIEIPRRAITGKNSADIRLVVDAMDLSWSKEHIDTFVIVSGDSDFSPLVSKLKENGRHVIGLGMKASTSPLLANGCDEFIYYEDLEHAPAAPRAGTRPAGDLDGAFALLAETVRALQRENFDVIQASLVKDTMKRKRPAFSEAALGYRNFSDLLGAAQEAGVITLRKDERSGTYMVTDVAGERVPGRRDVAGTVPSERARPREGRRPAGAEAAPLAERSSGGRRPVTRERVPAAVHGRGRGSEPSAGREDETGRPPVEAQLSVATAKPATRRRRTRPR